MREYFMKTKRIGFSKWLDSDFSLALALWGNPAVTKFISAKGIFTNEEISNRLKQEMENDRLHNVQYYPIFELLSDAFVGCCGLRPYEVEDNAYELGFHLLPEYWEKGIATEVGEATKEYAFTVLGATNLYAGHHPDNHGSKRALEKLGFWYLKDIFYKPTGLYHPFYQIIG